MSPKIRNVPYHGPREQGRWPERWWCRIVGHRWADWTDNGNRVPCDRCWHREPVVSGDAPTIHNTVDK